MLQPAFSGLLPHPPIVVPAVGRERCTECASTIRACRDFARRLVAARPRRLFLVSPHSPRRSEAFGIWDGATLRGDLARFAAPDAAIELANDVDLARELRARAAASGIATWSIPVAPLDHGAVVPLWFLFEAGWRGPTCVASLPHAGRNDLAGFGRCVAEAIERGGVPTALVASGDMTHRATPAAPAGYDPRAVEFDRELAALIDDGLLARIADISSDLRALAAEDAADSATVVAAAHDFRPCGNEVLSYEHPFGVGYLVAVFHRGASAPAAIELLPAVAREAVAARLDGRAPRDVPAAEGDLARRAPVFVTVRQRDTGALRGCIGSLEPHHSDLVQETLDRAVAAATEDPRFPALRGDELQHVSFEVSVLEQAEPVRSAADLDPREYGVIVRDATGARGILLPDIEGIDTPEQQVAIARQKAGIPPWAEVELARFRAAKARER